ncbi:MAG: hypothetical protein WD824_16400 [Cyclobacteriaceae bacterium]
MKMEKVIKIMIVEDSTGDLDLLERELRRESIEFISRVVTRKHEFQQALYEFTPDVISF